MSINPEPQGGRSSINSGSMFPVSGGWHQPLFDRLLLRVYPPMFRADFGVELGKHLVRQRAELRYQTPVLGTVRFWWEAGSDALMTGAALRWSGLRERLVRVWTGRRSAVRDGSSGPNQDPPRGIGPALEAIARDIRYAVRSLSRTPGYALVFVATLGLGIGANTAMFSAVNGVLLRPLPHEDGDRLVYLRQAALLIDVPNMLFSVPEIDDYRQGAPSLGAVAEFSALSFTMLGYDRPRRVRAGIVTGNYFGVMGLSATLGRTIGPEDEGEEAPGVIVLSDAYWRTAFGADPAIIGTTVEMNGRSATFVGVAEPVPPYPERTDIYVNMSTSPHHLDASMNHDRVHRMTEVFGRLAPGATVESARVEVAAITQRIHAEYPEAYDAASGYDVSVTPLKTQLTSRARPTLLLLLGTALFVLIIACANLANLTLTRVLRRERELAIRVSLGGSERALRRGLLVESLVLATVGTGVGLLIASVSLDLLVGFAARYTSRAAEIQLDLPVLGFAVIVAVTASLFFALLPPLPTSDSEGGALTNASARSTVGSGAKRIQRGLVVAQVATSVVILIGAGLLVRTMLQLNRIDPGFDTAQILTMDIPTSGILSRDDEVRNRYLALLSDVQALPGVENAALTNAVPLTNTSFRIDIAVEGHQPDAGAPAPMADLRVVSPGYFEVMGIDILRGRGFVSTDEEMAGKVVVINESMARAYFGERDPIGRRIAWNDELVARFIGVGNELRTVVGVVEDTRDQGLDVEPIHTMYNPYPQVRFVGSLVVRATGLDAGALLPAIRETVLFHDPDQPIANVATIGELGSNSVAERRLNTVLLGGFALLALIIAAVGIGGVLGFSVGSRTREFGVRSALGAARHQILSGVLAEGATLALVGVLLGGLAAMGLTRFISQLLFGVPAFDPVTFIAVALLLGGVALLASWAPAWRAASVSPMEALRSE